MISRYGLFCCFRSLAHLITSLELPLTVSSSRVIYGPLTHTMLGWEDVDDRLGRIVAEGALGTHVVNVSINLDVRNSLPKRPDQAQ